MISENSAAKDGPDGHGDEAHEFSFGEVDSESEDEGESHGHEEAKGSPGGSGHE